MRVLGVDIGGTFTDFACLDTESGALHTFKLLTTPEDPGRAVLDGVRSLLRDTEVDRVVHGTTLVTNAIVERKGARTALLTTKGFRDVLEIRREGRYDLYDLALRFPEPLAPRERRYEAHERVDERGDVLTALDPEQLERELAHVPAPESWAVCFLHAYANPEHERRAAEVLAARFPGVPVTVSHETAPELREYERTSTTVANAYVRPVAERYLRTLAAGLNTALERETPLHIMLSDGGLTAPDTAAAFPIRIVESGPAGGVIGAWRLAQGAGETRVLSLDMGGTTAKIAFLDAGGPRTQSTFEVDRRHRFKKGSGLPVLVPSIDLVEIGAGGGSLASRGPLGTLVVGPESAGADPGPACYGKGSRATVTDADVVLGLLNPAYFLGGAMPLDADASHEAIRRDVAEPLGLDVMQAAHGVHRLVGSLMADAARVHASERGVDLAAHTLVAFGGAGPVHAWSVAAQLGVRRILFPAHAGVASALGFLAAPPAYEVARSHTTPLDALQAADAARDVEELASAARDVVSRVGTGPITVTAAVDMRYRGQGAEVRVPLAGLAVDAGHLRAAFDARYRELYGRTVEGIPVEVVTWRVRAERPAPAVPALDTAGAHAPQAGAPPVHSTRTAWMPDADAPGEVPVYRRDAFTPGMRFDGPALVEETECTLVIGNGRATVLPGGAVFAEVES